VLLDGELPSLRGHVYLGLMTLAILAVGILVYRSAGPRAVEEL
jgi:ABC-type polysaccharide/polyol phosphate export permease